MKILRTPDECFAGLPDYSFSPHYVEIPRGDGAGDLRMHYLNEGDASATDPVCTLSPKHGVVEAVLDQVNRSPEAGDRLQWVYRVDPGVSPGLPQC